jgi:hypothetical protein
LPTPSSTPSLRCRGNPFGSGVGVSIQELVSCILPVCLCTVLGHGKPLATPCQRPQVRHLSGAREIRLVQELVQSILPVHFCMYVCMHVCMYVCVCLCVCVCVCMHTRTDALQTHSPSNSEPCPDRVCVCVCLCVCVCVCVCVYTRHVRACVHVAWRHQMVTLFGAFHHVYYRRSSSFTRTDSVAFDIIWVFITAVSTLYRRVCTYVCMYVSGGLRVCVSVSACVCVCVGVWVWVCGCVWVCVPGFEH